MIIRVKVSDTYSEVKFDFDDIAKAFVFAQLVAEHGYRDKEQREPLEATIKIITEKE